MGAFRDDRQALLSRIDALESELGDGRRDAALRELETLREQVAAATARVQKDEADLASLATRLEAIEGSLRGDVITTPAPRPNPAHVAAGCFALLLVCAFVIVIAGQGSSPAPIEVRPIPPTAPVPPRIPLAPSEDEVEVTPDDGASLDDRLAEVVADRSSDAPSRSAIVAAMRAVAPETEPCADRLTRGGTIVFRATIVFASTGEPTSVEVTSEDEPHAARCVERALESLRVLPFERESFSVSYPIRLTRP